MAQPVTDCISFLGQAKNAIENAERIKKSCEQLSVEEKQLERQLEAEKKALADEISFTIKKRQEETVKEGKGQKRNGEKSGNKREDCRRNCSSSRPQPGTAFKNKKFISKRTPSFVLPPHLVLCSLHAQNLKRIFTPVPACFTDFCCPSLGILPSYPGNGSEKLDADFNLSGRYPAFWRTLSAYRE